MKRDLDLARNLLFQVEELATFRSPVWVGVDGQDAEVVVYHVMLLYQAGLIRASEIGSKGSDDWRPLSLTWQGHEFLDASRRDDIWQKAKATASLIGGVGFSILKDILIDLLKQESRKIFGGG